MSLPDEFRALCVEIFASDLFQQTAPIVVLLLVPTIFYLVASTADYRLLSHQFAMVLETLGMSIPWTWPFGGNSLSVASEGNISDRRKMKKVVRTRTEQIAMNGLGKHDLEKERGDGYYPGLVNISGTYCFMNSTLQALASLSYLQPHIEAIHTKAEALDVPTPVVDALRDLLHNINKPRSSYRAIRPNAIIEALSHQPDGRRSSLFNSREHQDAQELFQLLSECIKNESASVDKEGYRDRGLGGLSQTSSVNKEIGKSVFDGLTANRRSCVVCGYTEAVMHFTLDNWQLAVPRAASCRLEDCLDDYTTLEVLHDCICRKCSLLATHKRLLNEIIPLEEATKPPAKPSTSKKKRLKEVHKMERRVKAALEEGRIEDHLPDVRMEKVFSKTSTKQAMIARPPPVLALHINRSVHYGHRASRNNVRVIFPEVLDVTPFTTSGSLSVVPTSAISTPSPAINRSTTPTPSLLANPRTLYRLSAVVCHYGQHSFGHYICYRRKPRNPNLSADRRWMPPRLIDPLHLEDDASIDGGLPHSPYVWEDDQTDEGRRQLQSGRGWLRISDDSVRECGIESVLQEGVAAFMLYYERVVHVAPGVYPSSAVNMSEETLKPEMRKVDLNGSVGSLISEVGIGVLHHSYPKAGVGQQGVTSSIKMPEPRVVRSVATGRKRSLSVSETLMARSLNGMPVLPASSSLPNEGIYTTTHINGSASYSDISQSLATSAPSLLGPKRPLSPTTPPAVSLGISGSPSSTLTTYHAHLRRTPSPSTRHSRTPKLPLPPAGPSPVIGLKA